VDRIEALVTQGVVSPERIDLSYQRILKLRDRVGS
jgi:hypothetical protein